nr:uncharacterized protein LOC109152007 [Ipomoea batatas]
MSAVLGKDDHSGSVRGIGAYSTIQGVFSRPDRKQSTSSGILTTDAVKHMMDKCKQDTIMEVEAKMKPKIDSMDQQLKFLMKNISGTHLFSQGVSVGTPQSVYTPYDPPLCDLPPTRSSCHSVDTYPVTTIKSPKRCSLAVCPDVGVTPTVVAKGMVHPSIDGVMEYATIAHIVGNFVQWPVHLVFLDENLPTDNKKTKDQSGDLSATGTRTPIVNDDALQQLGDNCKYLVSLLTAIPLDKDYIDVEIDESIFHHKNMKYIFVMMNDIKDLLTMSWLDVSIIQVFIL